MANSEKHVTQIIGKTLVYIFLILFPLGQLMRFESIYSFGRLSIQPIDIIALLSLPFLVRRNIKQPPFFKYVGNYFLVILFSGILALGLFSFQVIITGLFYILRSLSYASLLIVVYNCFVEIKEKRTLILYMIFSVTLVALLGWVQYIFIPDLTNLKYIGWDDHLYRLVGSFLDPGFTGIILVLGFILILAKFLEMKNIKLIPLLLFFILSIAFTYSRASYLSLSASLLISLFIFHKSLKWLFIFLGFFLLIVFNLPRPASEGVRLERLLSVYARVENYKETVKLFKVNPLFGVGYNNMCAARRKYLTSDSIISHSCSGSDSGLLTILATTGIIGFIIFIKLVLEIIRNLDASVFSKSFIISSAAVLVNSNFINSLFYPWVLGWMVLLLGISVERKIKK